MTLNMYIKSFNLRYATRQHGHFKCENAKLSIDFYHLTVINGRLNKLLMPLFLVLGC